MTADYVVHYKDCSRYNWHDPDAQCDGARCHPERPMPKPKTPDPALPNEGGRLPTDPPPWWRRWFERIGKRREPNVALDPNVPFEEVGEGLSPAPWKVTLYCEPFSQYEGHAFITADPKGLARSVCEGHIDDMVWIAAARNAAALIDGLGGSDQ